MWRFAQGITTYTTLNVFYYAYDPIKGRGYLTEFGNAILAT